jgi:hypothetical protein
MRKEDNRPDAVTLPDPAPSLMIVTHTRAKTNRTHNNIKNQTRSMFGTVCELQIKYSPAENLRVNWFFGAKAPKPGELW